jgi:hypothetical protein
LSGGGTDLDFNVGRGDRGDVCLHDFDPAAPR